MNKIAVPYVAGLSSVSNTELKTALVSQGNNYPVAEANWEQLYPEKPECIVFLAHDSRNLHALFLVKGYGLRAVNTANQSPVSQDSCVEIFLAPSVQGEYWNFEFNCIGGVNSSHRIIRPEPTRLTDDEISQIRRLGSCGNKPFNEKEGYYEWDLLVSIPFSLLKLQGEIRGKIIKGNIYKCSSASIRPHYLSLFPIATPKPDFHRPDFFGDIELQ